MRAKSLMVQGTASSVGKSTLVTALCRILKQEGLSVAPFKAQNMSLNSFVTPDGGEIGRAQAVQAEAAGIEPTVEMNPVLLKPEADNRCQLIVKGKPLRHLAAADYPSIQKILWHAITESVDLLLARYDAVVIEGAGSPAEVNLKDRDLVNMRVALYSNAPVLLVADIDRGGVFASLVGTLELLDPREAALIKAFVINKFRGDLSLLRPGLDWLEQRTNIAVAGVVPYYYDIHIAEEDSVALEKHRAMKNPKNYSLDIAVIALPHMANFDDFDPFEHEPEIRLRYVEPNDELGKPDLIILPGTKSTMADLRYLREIGRDKEIIERVKQGTPIIGVCGGYQMLGESICDPERMESTEAQIAGLALLPISTRFLAVKSTHQVKARALPRQGLLQNTGGMQITGYEIHMGETAGDALSAPFQIIERSQQTSKGTDGCLSTDGNVLGTYIHGLFHNEDFRRAILSDLAARKGCIFAPTQTSLSQKEPYDRLASLVRSSLDMKLIFRLLDLR
jgi:adenosylcobyric acid synthase